MSLMKKLILLNLSLIMVLAGYIVFRKESIISKGNLVLFRLAPVDPRSLLQGDYMRLNYAETQGFPTDSIPTRGYMVFVLDSGNIGRKVRFQSNTTPLGEGEKLLKYYCDGWMVGIGAQSYFFQEGQGEQFDKAKFGGLRIAENGETVLIGLYDEQRNLIIPVKVPVVLDSNGNPVIPTIEQETINSDSDSIVAAPDSLAVQTDSVKTDSGGGQ